MELSELLYPVSEHLLDDLKDILPHKLGKLIRYHSEFEGMPNLESAKLALIGVAEDRGSIENKGSAAGVDKIRSRFYRLYPGNWQASCIADLGNLRKGNSLKDTYAALQMVCEYLFKNQIIPIVIGGSNDLLYPMYLGFSKLEQYVDITSADAMLDIGTIEEAVNDTNYLSHLVLQKPYILNNFTNIGYQTYLVSPEELQLMDKMFFDHYRLGDLKPIKKVEPLVRSADILSFDMISIKASDNPGHSRSQPNGFTGEEACAIMRYAGLSDKLMAVGLFGYNPAFDHHLISASLAAEMIWYFVEGFFNRKGDYPLTSKRDFLKFTVIIEEGDYELVFYKNPKTSRWWLEVPQIINGDTTMERNILIPCNEEDYQNAVNQEIPVRWWKAYQKTIAI